MELSDLRIFQAVARCQSFSKAAERLGYVQPNITLRIKKLENDLQVPLFRRTNRGVEVLPSAVTLLAYADKILSLMDEAEEKLTTQMRVSIGATPILSAQLFPKIVQQVRRHYPLMKVEVKTGKKEQLYSELKQDLIDGIFVNEKTLPDGFISLVSYTEKLFLVSARSPVQNDGNGKIAVVNKNPQCPYRNTLLQYLEQKKDDMAIIEYDTLEPIIKSVEGTDAIAVLPQSLVTSRMKKISLPKEMNSIRIHFVVRQGSRKKKGIKRIVESMGVE
ncbi:MAG: LysR family transcriptional regulator [Sporolactobacillus sp.]